MNIKINLNGKIKNIDVKPDEYLVDTLRNMGLSSVKRGCETSNCGLCTIWLNKKPVLSCSVLSVKADGLDITTIEGLKEEAEEFASILVSEGSDQCGYCSPGFILTVLAMKNELVNPTDEEIDLYLTGNLCRCTGYKGQLRAVKKYLGVA